MQKTLLLLILILTSIKINAQYIQSLSVSQSNNETIGVTLVVCEDTEIGYISNTYSIVNNTIDLIVCYWLMDTNFCIPQENLIEIPIQSGNQNYILNVTIYNSISQDVCDYYSITETATLSFSTPLTEPIYLSNSLNETNHNITFYPNPINNVLFLDLNNETQIFSVLIFNILGSRIKEIINPTNDLNLNEMESGIYILYIETNKGQLIKRIVKE